MESHELEHSMSCACHTLLWLMLAWSVTVATAGCPKVCECKWRDGREMVVCRNANFIDVPRGLEPTTQVLDLRNNNLRILPRDSFAYSGLLNLQKLWLNFCNIMWVEKGAFRKLSHVKDLDMSNNYLRTVPSAALADIVSLRELRLAHNDLTVIPANAFLLSPNLVHLDISYNTIEKIEDGALQVLKNIEILNLSGNKIKYLNASELRPLQVLRVIKIDGNPWHCDCHLRQLSHWMRSRKLTASVPPSCSQPSWLHGRDWQRLEDSHFVCAPHTTAVAPRVLAADRDNVTLMCRVESEVQVTIDWLVDETPVRNTNMSHRFRVREYEDRNRVFHVSNLTIFDVGAQDQGIYRCLAANKAGTSVTEIMLQVSHEVAEVRIENVERAFRRRGLLGGISAFLIVLFIACGAVYCRGKDRSLQLSEESKKTEPLTMSLQQDPGDYRDSQDNEADQRLYHKQSWVVGEASSEGVQASGFAKQPDLPEGKGDATGKVPSNEAASCGENRSTEKAITKIKIEEEVHVNDEKYSDQDVYSSEYSNSPSYPPLSGATQFPDLLDLPRSHLGDLKASQQREPMDQTERLTSGLTPSFSASERLAAPSQNYFPYKYSRLRHGSFSRSNLMDRVHASSLSTLPVSECGLDAEEEFDARLSPSDPYRFEYHTLQLEKFLREYRRLQEQLLLMKQSYETEQRIRSTSRLDEWLEADGMQEALPFRRLAETSFTLKPSSRSNEPLKSILKKNYAEGRVPPRRYRASSLQIVDPREWSRGFDS